MWNEHRVRPCRQSLVPSGKPNVMFSCPELYDTTDFTVPVLNDVCDRAFRDGLGVSVVNKVCDEDVRDLCLHVMSTRNLSFPTCVRTATGLYLELVEACKTLL